MSKEWTLKSAWTEWHGKQQKPTPEDVSNYNITEFDKYLSDVAVKAAQEADPIKRAKIMHCAIVYGLPYLNKRPRLKGSLEEIRSELKRQIVAAYSEYCSNYSESPKKRIVNAINNFEFGKFNENDWWEIWDAVGYCGPDDPSHEMNEFREFARLNHDLQKDL